MKISTGITLVALMAATTITAFAQGSGADTYKAKCLMCHAADGTASGPAGKAMNVPSFKTSKLSEAADDCGDEGRQREDAGVCGQADGRADQGRRCVR